MASSLLSTLEGVAEASALLAPQEDSALLEFIAAHPITIPLLEKHRALLRSLLNMGVRESRLQLELYAAVQADATSTAVFERLRGVLDEQFFLGGSSMTSIDVRVLSPLFDVLSLAFPPSLIPAKWQPVARWFSTVCATPLVEAALRTSCLATGGGVRVGGQIDLRAEPEHVAKLADASVALNSGHVKAASQRNAEDAAKATEVHPGGSAASATHAATSVAAAKPVVVPAATVTQPASNKTLPLSRYAASR